jgi:hypothetical protein
MSDIRDVTPQNHLREVIRYILNYLRHPIKEIAKLPDWRWPLLFLVTVGVAIVSGVIAGFIPPNPYRIAAGLILSPIVSLVMTSVMAVFFYYYFQVFERRTCSLRHLYTLILFANIPFYIFQTIADLIWVITPVAFAFTAFILVVGLVENFQMEKRRAIRLIGIILILVILIWAWNRIDIGRLERSMSAPSTVV